MRIRGETMCAKAYPVMCQAVEIGVTYGLMRAHKHTDTPTQEQIADEIERAVINEMCERFDFPDEPQ